MGSIPIPYDDTKACHFITASTVSCSQMERSAILSRDASISAMDVRMGIPFLAARLFLSGNEKRRDHGISIDENIIWFYRSPREYIEGVFLPCCKYTRSRSQRAACNNRLPNKLGDDDEANVEQACQAQKPLTLAPLHSAVLIQRGSCYILRWCS